MQRLLFIDDDIDFLFSNEQFFLKEGFQVEAADTPQSALKMLETYKPDCIIMDVMLPDMTGFELYKKIRAVSNSPVIFLSGCAGENDKVHGLLLGGNDYMVKPYSLRELSARIQVQIRKTSAAPTSSLLTFPPLTLDIIAHKVYYHEAEIPLSNLEYQLLYLFVLTPNETIPFEEIGRNVWGYYAESDRRIIMVAISRLRKKLESYAGLENMVETVWTKGYKFVGNRGRGA